MLETKMHRTVLVFFLSIVPTVWAGDEQDVQNPTLLTAKSHYRNIRIRLTKADNLPPYIPTQTNMSNNAPNKRVMICAYRDQVLKNNYQAAVLLHKQQQEGLPYQQPAPYPNYNEQISQGWSSSYPYNQPNSYSQPYNPDPQYQMLAQHDNRSINPREVTYTYNQSNPLNTYYRSEYPAGRNAYSQAPYSLPYDQPCPQCEQQQHVEKEVFAIYGTDKPISNQRLIVYGEPSRVTDAYHRYKQNVLENNYQAAQKLNPVQSSGFQAPLPNTQIPRRNKAQTPSAQHTLMKIENLLIEAPQKQTHQQPPRRRTANDAFGLNANNSSGNLPPPPQKKHRS